jgi:hypothetical protein
MSYLGQENQKSYYFAGVTVLEEKEKRSENIGYKIYLNARIIDTFYLRSCIHGLLMNY